jgi:hypothetical protein
MPLRRRRLLPSVFPHWLKGFVTAGQAPVTSYWSEQWRVDPQ